MTDEPGSSELRPELTPGPPVGGVFSLERRPAPGLYFLAWLLAVGGIGLVLVGLLAADRTATTILLLGGLAALICGLSSGAGYQVLARADRPADRYRGPSPVIVFGIAVAATSALALLLGPVGLIDFESPAGFLIGLLLVASGYLLSLWLFVVRTGSLSWREMGWPVRGLTLGRLLDDGATAIAVMAPANLVISIAGGLLAALLGVKGAQTIPTPRDDLGVLLLVLAVVIVAPTAEELFFRGFSLVAWWRDRGGRTALIRSALFFAIVHIANVTGDSAREGVLLALITFMTVLPLGFLLGWLFQRRGIVAAVLGHAASNATALVLFGLATRLAEPA